MCQGKLYWRQIWAVQVGCLLCLNQGLLQAWISPFMLKIIHGQEYPNITVNAVSYCPIISPLSMSLSAILCYKICERYGRKTALLFSVVPAISAWATQAFATQIHAFYLAKVYSGVSDAFVFSVLPVYVGEVTDPRLRGRLGSTLTCFTYLGFFLMNVLGSYLSNTETSLICITVPVTFCLLFGFIPETPYYYLSKKKDIQARESLKWFMGKDDVEEQFRSIRTDVQRQMMEAGSWKELITEGRNRRALFGGVILRIGQQMAGISAFDWYTQMIFEKIGSSLSAENTAQVYMALCFVVFSTATFFVGFLKRRNSFISSLYLCAVILLLQSLYLYVKERKPERDLSAFRWVPDASMFFFVIFASYGIALLPTLMTGELFSVSIKAKAAAVLVTVYGLAEVTANTVFYQMQDQYGLHVPFALFASCSIFFGVLSYYFLPETKDKTLEEIQLSMKGNGICSRMDGEVVEYERRLRGQTEFLVSHTYLY